MTHQGEAVASGYWPLFRFRPSEDKNAKPLQLDSKAPNGKVEAYLASEPRFAMLKRSDPERAEALWKRAHADVDERWRYYSQMAAVERALTVDGPAGTEAPAENTEK